MLKICGIIVLFCGLVLGQDDEKFTYAEQSVLRWEDFKATPDESSSYQASSNTGMGYSWSYNTYGGSLNLKYEVKSHFYPNLSWVKKGADATLLQHEQIHFDISELHARMLRKTMSEYAIRRNIRRDLKLIYEKAEAERRAMQKAYDLETNHSIDTVAQKQWGMKVQKLLEAHEAFAN